MKIYELAKKSLKTSKEVIAGLKEAGIEAKTPLSEIPAADLAKAKALFPESVHVKARMEDVIIPAPAPHVDKPAIEVLRSRPFKTVAAEGLEPRFDQYLLGIRRQIVDGVKKFSLLTVAFDRDTLEMKVVKEEFKRTEAMAISDLKSEMIKRKVV